MSAPIVSYAQNQEDIILYRALRDVRNGFYIDVGAQQPVVDSVTKLFYEHGWHGINIDPVPQWVRMLEADRPHDINLQMAIGARRERMPFFAIPDTGLSTANPAFWAQHAKMGFPTEEITVDVHTLDEICAQYGVHEVHFLKIDVEGTEKEVISGFSFDPIRPWIVVVEAIEPVSGRRDDPDKPPQAIPTHAAWEPLLLTHGYEFVYWDGLNRFYLAREHKDLRPHFSAPPNPLDEFIRYGEIEKHNRILQLEAEHKHLTDMATSTQHQITALEQDKARLVQDLAQDTAQLEQNRVDLQLLRDERDALRRDRDVLSGERNVWRGQHEALCGERDALRGERDALHGERDMLHGERNLLNNQQSALRREYDVLHHEHDVLRHEYDVLRHERDALQGERDVLRGQHNTLSSECAALRADINWRLAHQANLEQTLAQQHTALHALLHSRSWQVTRPLRWLARQRREIHSLPRRSMRRMLLAALNLTRNHSAIRQMVRHILTLVPARIRNRLMVFAQFHPQQPPHAAAVAAPGFHVSSGHGNGIPGNPAGAAATLPKSGTQLIYARLRAIAASSN